MLKKFLMFLLMNNSNLFRVGDRVSFMGNSITRNGFHLRYLEELFIRLDYRENQRIDYFIIY